MPLLSTYVQKNYLNEYEIEQVEIGIKYENYILKEKELVDRINNLEKIKLNPDFDYHSISALIY